MMAIPAAPGERFLFLDALRGLGAIVVMVYHYSDFLRLGIAPMGMTFVDFFFVLSGFVIAHAYGDRLGDMGLGGFLGRRIVRLYPMFFLGLMLGSVLLVLRSHAGIMPLPMPEVMGSILANLFYLPFFHDATQTAFATRSHGELFPGNSPSWSLFFELAANIAFVLLLRVRMSLMVLSVVAAYLVLVFRVKTGFGVGGWGTDNIFSGLPRVYYGFFAGCVLYALYRSDRFDAARQVGARLSLPLMAAVCAACLIVAQWALDDMRVSYIVAVSVLPFLVLAGALVVVPPGLGRACAWLGGLSYPIYCLHYPVGLGLDYLVRQGVIAWGAPALFALGIVTTVLLSMLAIRFYEARAQAMLAGLLLRVRRTASA